MLEFVDGKVSEVSYTTMGQRICSVAFGSLLIVTHTELRC